jgi:hypothetical protein
MHLDAIPTLPIELDKLREDERDLKFQRIKEWLNEHPDGKEMLCAKEKISRNYLRNLHPRLSEYMAKRLGYPCEILNGATANGNRTVLEMKNSRLELEVEQLEKKRNNLKHITQDLEDILVKEGGYNKDYVDEFELLRRAHESEKMVEKLKQTLKDNDIPLPNLDKERRALFEATFGTKKMAFIEGCVLDSKCPVKVIDITDREVIKRLPVSILNFIQEKHLLQGDDFVKGIKWGDGNGRVELLFLFKAEKQESLIGNIKYIKDVIEKERIPMIAFPHLDNDEFEVAERILSCGNFNTEFYLGENYQKKKEDEELALIAGLKRDFKDIGAKMKEDAEKEPSESAEPAREEEYNDGEMSAPERARGKLKGLGEKGQRNYDLGR